MTPITRLGPGGYPARPYGTLDKSVAVITPHKYLRVGAGQVRESDMRYLALVDGVTPPAAVTGYMLWYIHETTGRPQAKDGAGNIYTLVLEELTNTLDRLLTLRAGTASEAPIKLQPGTNLATPEAGAAEYDGDAFYFTPAVDRHSAVMADTVKTATATVDNTTTETTVYTDGISAHELHAGQVIRVILFGRYSTANSSDTYTLRLKIAGATIATFTSDAGNVTDGFLRVEFAFTVRSVGGAGSVWAHAWGVFDGSIKSDVSTGADTVDTTAADDITVTVQWSAADAGNTVSIDQAWAQSVSDA